MLDALRFTVPPEAAERFRAGAEALLAALADQPGCTSGRLGRGVDDPGRWSVVTEWVSVGAYRRALGATAVKLATGPLLGHLDPEPTGYEVLVAVTGGHWQRADSDRADSDRAEERRPIA